MSVTLKIISNKIPEIAEKMRGAVALALNRAALQHESLAKQMAPKDTGFLANSIQQTEQATAENLEAQTSVGADYGIYVELGTRKKSAQSYFSPTFEIAAAEAKKELTDVLK